MADGKKGMSGWTIGCLIAAGVGLCLVIPVTGIVAAIAIPNFVRYQCRSKQAEARSNLRQLYVAEQSYFAENDYFTSDLQAIGFKPEGSPRYLYGFAQAGPSLRATHPAGYDETRDASLMLDGFDKSKMVDSHGSALTASDLPSDTSVEREHFLAGAAGDLGAGGYKLDQWTIDEKGVIKAEFDQCSMGLP